MNTIFRTLARTGSNKPTSKRVWYSQYEGQEKREIRKYRHGWAVTTKSGEISHYCSTLRDAKGDMTFSGAKVFSELN